MRNSVKNTGGAAYDQVFKSIGDPHRLQILALLREKERSAGEILKALDVVQSTLSHHMKSLVDAGVVHAVRHGKWTYYSLNTEVLSEAALFLEEYAKGTKEPAGYAEKKAGEAPAAEQKMEDAGREPAAEQKTEDAGGSAAQKEYRKEELPAGEKDGAGSSKKAMKEKTESASSSEEKEGKKKSKKGKKGKKNKK